MKPNHLIAINTLASYGQSLIGLFVAIFSARWILQALGPVDLGLFGVVGSLILLMSFLNNALTIGVSRFYAYSIGASAKSDGQEAHNDLQRWFNTALTLHLGMALLAILLGVPIGEYAIRHFLNIPDDRLEICVVVFYFSIATAVLSILAVPFTAMYAAHQKIAQTALVRVAQSLLTLALAWILLGVNSDRLLFYGAGMAAIAAVGNFFLAGRACILFKACQPSCRHLGDLECFKQLFSYVGWKFFGTACVVSRDGGVPVMINLLFGPAVNAAFGIANRVSIQTSALANSLQSAFQPAIVATEGSGDRAKMLGMSLQVCRFGSLLVIIFVLPLVIEMKVILDIWLVNPPPFTKGFCQWVLGMLLVDKMTSGAMIAVNAHGKIAVYEFVQGSTFLLALPLIYALHKTGLDASSVGLSMFISTAIYCIGRLVFAQNLVNFPIISWSKQVAFPVTLIMFSGVILAFIIQYFIQEGLIRLLVLIAVLGGFSLASGFFILVSKSERKHIFSVAYGLIRRGFERFTQPA